MSFIVKLRAIITDCTRNSHVYGVKQHNEINNNFGLRCNNDGSGCIQASIYSLKIKNKTYNIFHYNTIKTV
jgi:hypothetical protein